MTQTKNPHVLETESIGKLLIQYSIPAIIAMTVTSVYNIVDSIFIGHGVGPLAISGLALTFPLMNLIIAFSTLIGVGGAAISSIYLGQKDDLKATEVLHNVLILCILTGICFGGITYYFLDEILIFFGASTSTLPYARDFMQVLLLGNPVSFLFIGLNNVMRATDVIVPADGRSKHHSGSDFYLPPRLGNPGSCDGYDPGADGRAGMGVEPFST